MKNVRLRGMAVIIQVQVHSAASGVLFTHTPGKQSNGLYVEYCEGAGEALVSGRVSPGSFTISRSAPYRATVCEALNVPADRLVLAPDAIAALARTSLAIERHFGTPQDIEWTMDAAGDLYFVQARPITTQVSSVLWSNSNVNENFPDVITPLLYSIARNGYYHYFRNLALAFGISRRRVHAMEDAFRHIIGVHHSRMYYNLTSIHAVLREAPFGETLAQFFNQFTGASEIAERSSRDRPTLLHQAIEAGKIAVKTTWQYLFFERRVVEFERTVDRFASSTKPEDLQNRPALALRDDLRRFMDIRCHHWTNASLADTAAMVCYGLLQLVLGRAYPEGKSSLHNSLLKGLATVVSVQPAVQLWEISRRIRDHKDLTHFLLTTESTAVMNGLRANPNWRWLEQDIAAYLNDWGFRFSGELMLTVPGFDEEPAPLFDMLKTYVKTEGASPVESIERLQRERVEETDRILRDLRTNKRLPRIPRTFQAPLLRTLLTCTHRAIEKRERARLKQALLYGRCRRIALAIGDRLVDNGKLEDATDVFFFEYSELDDLLSGYALLPVTLNDAAALRRRATNENRGFPAPDTFTLAAGAYFSPGAVNAEESNCAASDDLAMKGVGVCGGRVTSRAAVLGSIADADLLRQGDILVTRQTDPGWAPVFPLIRGLVIERGGMLSHGAIIAREFGLPCVAGVKDALIRIPQHCQLAVDGDTGNVRTLG
jgi:pyruvate,water dikinase